MRPVLSFERRRARRRGVADGRGGAVTAIQRFGSAANLNVHFHSLVVQGVFAGDGARFVPLPAPSDRDVWRVLATVRRRIVRLTRRHGIDVEGDGIVEGALCDELAEESPLNLLLYHGVFAPHAARRRAAVARARDVADGRAEGGSAPGSPAGVPPQPAAGRSRPIDEAAGAAAPRKHGWVRWADLLRRVFEVDVLHCARCGGRLRFIAAIDDPEVVRRILKHLGLPTSVAPPLPPRPPPGSAQTPFDWA